MKYFLSFWILCIIIIPLLFSFISIKHWLLPWWSWSIAATVFSFLCRLDVIRIIVRSGGWGKAPAACNSKALLTMFKRPPTVVGRGWGYFLMRISAKAPVLHMYNFTGRRHDDRWGGGTTIRTVIDYYRKQGLTFPSHPSYDDITIGSWFAAGCHGSGGDAGAPSSSVLKCAEVVCFDPPGIQQIKNYETLRSIFDTPGHNCVVTWIEFHHMWASRRVQKSAEDVNTLESCQRWLSKGAILRVLFVGAARDAIGIRWQDVYKNVEHYDPHCCSKFCTFLQADICSACCGCHENYENWNGISTLREANRWSPTIWPFETLVTVLGGYKNFEIIFRVPKMTPTVLLSMIQGLREMHKETGGRTEIRFGTQVVFWDVSLQHSFDKPFIKLEELGVTRVALHMSKYNPKVDILPVVPVGDIYFNKETKIKF